MIFFIAAIIFLTLLYLVASKTENLIFNLVYLLTKNQTVAMTVLSVVIYPGVLIHELSHLIMAVVLFVPVKHINLIPEKTATGINSGSVTTADTDIFRKVLIGIAPLFTGVAALWAVIYFLVPPIPLLCHSEGTDVTEESILNEILRDAQNDVFCTESIINNHLSMIISLYLLFSISSTMYSSKKDLQALKWFIPIVFVFVSICYILGFQGSWIVEIINRLDGLFQTLVGIVALPLCIQLVVFILLTALMSVRPAS